MWQRINQSVNQSNFDPGLSQRGQIYSTLAAIHISNSHSPSHSIYGILLLTASVIICINEKSILFSDRPENRELTSSSIKYLLGADLHNIFWSGSKLFSSLKAKHWFIERSEEHTSELQSRQYLVCRLLLEKKKKNK